MHVICCLCVLPFSLLVLVLPYQTNCGSTYVWTHTVCVVTNCFIYFIPLLLSVYLLPSTEFELTEPLQFTASVLFWKTMLQPHDTSVWFHSSISPSVRLTCYFHTSFVTTWLMSDLTKHSPPLLLFQSTPSPSNTRGLPPPTPQHGTPPIAAAAQNHSTTCQA